MRSSMVMPLGSEESDDEDGPPKRLDEERIPVPVPGLMSALEGGECALAGFGVGAEDEDFEGALRAGWLGGP